MGSAETSLRCFIGVRLPTMQRQLLDRALQDLRHDTASLNWVSPANWHLTLHFLGNVPAEHIPNLVVHICSGGFPAFNLKLGPAQALPNTRFPRILALGVCDGDQPLTALHQQLTAQLQAADHRSEDIPFRPHLTLARVGQKSMGWHARSAWLGLRSLSPFPAFEVTSFDLMQSTTVATGPVYTSLANIALAPAGQA